MPYRFTGKETDGESGFAYFGARYLYASQGRFLSVDPLTSAVPDKLLLSPQALNPFAYSLNNPEKFYDPDGELPHILAGAGAGAVIGLGIEGFRQAMAGEFNGRQLVAATLGGAVSGAMLGATLGTSLIVEAGSVALSSAAGGQVYRIALGERQSLGTAISNVGRDALFGLVTFGVVRGVGSADTRFAVPKSGTKLLPPPKVRGNPNKAPENGTIFVDSKGNAIITPPGGKITGSPDGRFIQARDANGNPTGVRIDGGHSPKTHTDPRALSPHAHVPGVTNADGTSWLPINQ